MPFTEYETYKDDFSDLESASLEDLHKNPENDWSDEDAGLIG